jgi:hypothetical protein
MIKDAASETKKPFSFIIAPQSTNGKKIVLCSNSQEEMDEWVIVLNQAIVLSHRANIQ